MALIRSFEPTAHERHGKQTSTRALYEVFQEDGETFLQLETVGSESRVERGATSQTLRLDRRAMLQLLEILAKALGKSV